MSETIIPIFEIGALGAARRGIEHALYLLAAADRAVAVDALAVWDDMRTSAGSDDELRSCAADLATWTADRLAEFGRKRGIAVLRRAAAELLQPWSVRLAGVLRQAREMSVALVPGTVVELTVTGLSFPAGGAIIDLSDVPVAAARWAAAAFKEGCPDGHVDEQVLEAIAVLEDGTLVDVSNRVAEVGWAFVGDLLVSEIGEPKPIRRMEPEVIAAMHAAHDKILQGRRQARLGDEARTAAAAVLDRDVRAAVERLEGLGRDEPERDPPPGAGSAPLPAELGRIVGSGLRIDKPPCLMLLSGKLAVRHAGHSFDRTTGWRYCR